MKDCQCQNIMVASGANAGGASTDGNRDFLSPRHGNHVFVQCAFYSFCESTARAHFLTATTNSLGYASNTWPSASAGYALTSLFSYSSKNAFFASSSSIICRYGCSPVPFTHSTIAFASFKTC